MRAVVFLAALLSPSCIFYVAPKSDGPTLVRIENCANCHGEDGAGSPNGPTLEGLERHWSAETLAEFLAEPDAWRARTPRLAELALTHRNRMPSFRHLSGGERRMLAIHLLER